MLSSQSLLKKENNNEDEKTPLLLCLPITTYNQQHSHATERTEKAEKIIVFSLEPKEVNQAIPIKSLPNEIIMMILEYLEFHDLVNVAQVCKKFNRMIYEKKNKFMLKLDTDTGITSLINNFFNLRESKLLNLITKKSRKLENIKYKLAEILSNENDNMLCCSSFTLYNFFNPHQAKKAAQQNSRTIEDMEKLEKAITNLSVRMNKL